jgi:hypothetical protein
MIKANTFLELQDLFSDLVRKKMIKTNPLVVVNSYDEQTETAEVEVLGSKPYTVLIGVNPMGENFIACTCRGALENGNCYHGFSAFIKVRYLFKRERANKAKSAPKNDITEFNHAPFLKESKGTNERVGKIKI